MVAAFETLLCFACAAEAYTDTRSDLSNGSRERWLRKLDDALMKRRNRTIKERRFVELLRREQLDPQKAQALLPIERVELGSVEFWVDVVNLLAVFGLQDSGLIKDLLQWTTGVIKSAIGGRGKHYDGLAPIAPFGMLKLDPATIDALGRNFSSVSLEAEDSPEHGQRFKVVLGK